MLDNLEDREMVVTYLNSKSKEFHYPNSFVSQDTTNIINHTKVINKAFNVNQSNGSKSLKGRVILTPCG